MWKPGQKQRVAKLAGMRPSHFSDVLSRRRRVSAVRASLLVKASEIVLGYPIPLDAWLFNEATKHPAFNGDPVKGGAGDVG